jgi:hypothetical protein
VNWQHLLDYLGSNGGGMAAMPAGLSAAPRCAMRAWRMPVAVLG